MRWEQLKRARIKDVKEYIVGNLRYTFRRFLPFWMKEQIQMRYNSADRVCVQNGECKACGCNTPQLFYANKGCEDECYPSLFSADLWAKLKNGHQVNNWFIQITRIDNRLIRRLCKRLDTDNSTNESTPMKNTSPK